MRAQIFREFVSGEYPTEEEGLAQKHMWCQKYFQAKILIVSKQLDQMLISLQTTLEKKKQYLIRHDIGFN